MKLLALSWNYRKYFFETILHEQEAVAKIIPDTVFYGPGFIYNNNRVTDIIKEVYVNTRPDAIVCYISDDLLLHKPLPKKIIERYNVPKRLQTFPLDLDKVHVPKILIVTDSWNCTHTEWRRIILKNDFSAIFGLCPPFCSAEFFNKYFDSDIQKYLCIQPLLSAIDPNVFKDYGLPKQYDVMLFGRLAEFMYPLRVHFDRILRTQTDIRYYSRGNPAYLFYENDETEYDIPIRGAYAKAMNRSHIFLTCCTKYKIPVMKLFEALACKTLLMCDKPYGAEGLGLIDQETFVEVEENNFLEKIRYYLKRPDEMKRISENGYRLVHQRHTVEKRALEFKELLEKFILESGKAKTIRKPSYGFINYCGDLRTKCLKVIFIVIRMPLRIAAYCLKMLRRKI
ncbi:MAG: glycosyltransferase [Candidatus Omnitrophota bacterium]|nr:glycosyltransferase [Candidatus Omnitrophota bacterium]